MTGADTTAPGPTPFELLGLGMRFHSAECARLGSPLYAELLAAAADDLDAGGVTAELLDGAGIGLQTVPALRLMRAVHHLVLDGSAPQLAAYFPSAGGDAPAGSAWPVVRDVLLARRDRVRELFELPLQTNDVGRSAALHGALLRVCSDGPTSVRLLEPGASGGLNLWVDRYAYRCAGHLIGDTTSSVVLDEPWSGVPDPHWRSTRPRIVDRAGCDLHPRDPGAAEDRMLLLSSVWSDQTDRFNRTRAALDAATTWPRTVVRAGAGAWLRHELASRRRPGVATVVWHSLFWQYLPPAEQDTVRDAIEAAGAAATPGEPVVWIALEPDHHGGFAVTMTRWPGGSTGVLARTEDHGIPTTWYPADHAHTAR